MFTADKRKYGGVTRISSSGKLIAPEGCLIEKNIEIVIGKLSTQLSLNQVQKICN